MSRSRIPPQTIRDILHLKYTCNFSTREIAQECNIAKSTASLYLSLAKKSSLEYEQISKFNDQQIHSFFNFWSSPISAFQWEEVFWKLKRSESNRKKIWKRYSRQNSNPIQYSRFCDLYNKWLKVIDKSFRHPNLAGKSLHIDVIHNKIPIIDKDTGEIHRSSIIIALLPSSGLSFAQAVWKKTAQNFTSYLTEILEEICGCPQQINIGKHTLRTLNKSTQVKSNLSIFFSHYRILIKEFHQLPHNGTDKWGLRLFNRWITFHLNQNTYHDLQSLNDDITKLTATFNSKPCKHLKGSRLAFFAKYESDKLKQLPGTRFTYVEQKQVSVGPNLHVQIYGHYYSVPCKLYGKSLTANITSSKIEIFLVDKLVAVHQRCNRRNRYTTDPTHIPNPNNKYGVWSSHRFEKWASTFGPSTAVIIKTILVSRPYPQHSFNTCFAILSFGRKYGNDHLENACKTALEQNDITLRRIKLTAEYYSTI